MVKSNVTPVTVIQPVKVDYTARARELRELIYQVFVGLAPKGRSLPGVVKDAWNGTIPVGAIIRDDKRFADCQMYLKNCWLDQRKTLRFDVTDKRIIPITEMPTRSLDEALMSVYGYNPYIA